LTEEFEDYLVRIDKHVVKENYNMGLGFFDGWIFFKVNRREIYPLLYDIIAEMPTVFATGVTSMAAGEYVKPIEFKSDTLEATNIWAVSDKKHAYQLFYGVSPGLFRMYPAYPRATEINQLEVGMRLENYLDWGFVDGIESPLDAPSPRSQMFIPYGPKVGWAMKNAAPYAIQPLIRYIVNRLEIEPINDPDLVMKILENRVECTKATLGGLDNPYKESKDNYKQWWGVMPVNFTASRRQVELALRGVG